MGRPRKPNGADVPPPAGPTEGMRAIADLVDNATPQVPPVKPKVKEAGADDKKKGGSQASRLLGQTASWLKFHDRNGNAYVRVPVGYGAAVYRIPSAQLKTLLSATYYDMERDESSLAKPARDDVLDTLAAQAIHQGPCLPIGLRTAAMGEGVEIDRCSADFSAIRVTPHRIPEWCVVSVAE